MNKYVLLVFALTLTSCATQGPNTAKNNDIIEPIVWPATPEKARIKYLATIRSPEDLNIKKGLLTRIINLFAGSEDDGFSRPYAVSSDKDKLIVADPDSSSVHIFNLEDSTYKKINKIGKHLLSTPIGVAHDSKRLFIADSKLNKVFILDKDYALVGMIEEAKRPTGLALDTLNQHIYVADTISHIVLVFSTDGTLLNRIGSRGEQHLQFNFPSHLAFSQKKLIINDTMNFRIQATDFKGNYLFGFGQQGNASGYLTQPKGVAIDSDGNVYIADALANRIQIFDQTGDFLLEFGERGEDAGQFNMPTGLSISNDRIYVADSFNQRIQVFQYLKAEK